MNRRMWFSRLAWWFEPPLGVLGYGDGRAPRVGDTHTVVGPPELCHWGLHASLRVHDALIYADSVRLWRVRIGGRMRRGPDKIVGTERTYLACRNVSAMLLKYVQSVEPLLALDLPGYSVLGLVCAVSEKRVDPELLERLAQAEFSQ